MNITKKIDEYYAAIEEDPREYLGASIIGDECRRKLWYKYRWAVKYEFPGRMRRLFDRGHREERIFLRYLREIGITIVSEQAEFIALNGHFKGHADAIIMIGSKVMVAEFKTHNEKSFTKLKKHGVQKSHPKHYAQMQVYCYLMEMPGALYLAVNKNTDELKHEFVPLDKELAEYYVNRAKAIINSKEPLERISEDPTWYLCSYCPFKGICHRQEDVVSSCRTCRAGAPDNSNETGSWRCDRHGKKLSFKAQKDGCEDYNAITGEH